MALFGRSIEHFAEALVDDHRDMARIERSSLNDAEMDLHTRLVVEPVHTICELWGSGSWTELQDLDEESPLGLKLRCGHVQIDVMNPDHC